MPNTAPVIPSMAGVRWISAPNRDSRRCRSTLMSSGMVRMSRYPRTAHTMASPMPVLPLVGSTTVAPGRNRPRRSASSIMETAMRSLTLPPGLSDSILPSTTALPGLGTRLSRIRGVAPTSSRTDSATFGRLPDSPPRRVMDAISIGKG
jgi:hypothetical protein